MHERDLTERHAIQWNQIEDALRSINEQLRDAKDDRRMTKHQEKMAECLEVGCVVLCLFVSWVDVSYYAPTLSHCATR